jgi:ketosteroid isomerase-like protein
MCALAENLETARSYLKAIEQGETGTGLSKFFAPDVVFEEFPNRLTPLGRKRNLAESMEGAEKGRKLISQQTYKIKHEMADGNRVALEVEWIGTLVVPFGSIPAGGTDEGVFRGVHGIPGRENRPAEELRLFRGLVRGKIGE